MKKKSRKPSPANAGKAIAPQAASLPRKAAAPAAVTSEKERDALLYGLASAGVALSQIVMHGEHAAGAIDHIIRVTAELQPRDPVERMMIEQMIVTHARVIRLADLSSRQTSEPWRRQLSDEYERSGNLFCRQALAFREYREPRRPARQTNIARQQIVQQITDKEAPYDTALPPNTEGSKELAPHDPSNAAVASLDGAANTGGQTAECAERAPSRPALARVPGGEAAVPPAPETDERRRGS